jgi:hypothetical protein
MMRPQSFCFLIAPDLMKQDGNPLKIVVPDTINNRNNSTSRFIKHAVASGNSNSYVQMTPLTSTDQDSKMTWLLGIAPGSPSVPTSIQNTPGQIPILDFNSNSPSTFISLTNQHYPDQYLITYEGGWKPRLGYRVQDSDPGWLWYPIPNYLNTVPSQYDNILGLSGNYFYKTFYYMNSTKGVMTCSLNEPHLPALLSEITSENIDTVYYSSLFLID